MKSRYIRKLLITLTLFGCMASMPAYSKGWEPLKSEKGQSHRIAATSEIEIKAVRGIIYVTTSRNVNIKIFTILGSRIADDNLSPGSYQFVVPTHGVYIIKAGDLTCKVAV